MKSLYKTTLQLLLKNKKRTMATILGVLLSSVLLFSMGFIFSTTRDNSLCDVWKEKGYQHAIFENIQESDMDQFEEKNLSWIVKIKDLSVTTDGWKKVTLSMIDQKGKSLFRLSEGTFPKKETEIMISSHYAEEKNWKRNDQVTIQNQSYQVVGIYNESKIRYYQEGWDASQESIYTGWDSSVDSFDVYVRYKKPTHAFFYIDDTAVGLKKKIDVHVYDGIRINENLLKLEGSFADSKKTMALYEILFVSLFILSFVSYFIIYNSFLLSFQERKKLIGILQSIGASKKQLFHAVYLEIAIIGIIGMGLGFFLSLGIVKVGILFEQELLESIGYRDIQLSFYPQFMFLSFAFLLFTLILSALSPARRAFKARPIENIRLNQEVKLKKEKGKSNKIIKKVFGEEGILAYKNMKRNKKKYRMALISLCTSMILWIGLGTIITQLVDEVEKLEETPGYNISLLLPYEPIQSNLVKKVTNLEEVKDAIVYSTANVTLQTTNESGYPQFLTIKSMDDKSYNAYLKKLGLKEEKAVFVNLEAKRKEDQIVGLQKKFDKEEDIHFEFCSYTHGENHQQKIQGCYYEVNNLYVTEELPEIEESWSDWTKVSKETLLVSERQYREILSAKATYEDKAEEEMYYNKEIYLITDGYKKLDNEIKTIGKESSLYEEVILPNYLNINMTLYNTHMLILGIKFILYGVLGLVALTATTNIINTVNTNRELQRREFAILRSVGLSIKKFKKMTLIETLFLGLKSWLWGLPISLGIVFFLRSIFLQSEKGTFRFPTIYFLTSMIAILLIMILTTIYSVKKIKKENIIETIRNDNI